MFVDRKKELTFLNQLLSRQRAQLVLLFGRRRVGKTALLREWAAQSNLPYIYWPAEKERAELQRRKFYAKFLGVRESQAPIFASWTELWQAVAELLGEQRRILIIDEFPYAAQADTAAISSLQHAWDQYFKASNLVIALCGSHVQSMETLLTQQSPLFGRMTGQWNLKPLPFSSLREFFPSWSAEERIGLYAMVGGIPAYLEWLDPERAFVENIRDVILNPGSMFLAEPQFLLYDEVREPRTYLSILKTIGAGNHSLKDISNVSLIPSTNLSAYLQTLRELRLVERRLPATIRPAKRRQSRRGRYHIIDPYFRFYFRFLAPNQEALEFDYERVLEYIREGLRAFIGQTGFEELCQHWIRKEGRDARLAFNPEIVGWHWSRRTQIDIVGVNWQTKDLLLGECKWTGKPLNRKAVRELLENKTQHVLDDLSISRDEWDFHYAFFSRRGFTTAATQAAKKSGALLVSLDMLDT